VSTLSDDELDKILERYAGLEGLGPTGNTIRVLVANVRAEREAHAATKSERDMYIDVFEAMGGYDHDHPTVAGLRTTFKLRAEKAERELAAERARTDALVALLRCKVTKNPMGTDTWMVGYKCPCESCQAYLAIARARVEGR
jgi:hypothetical protein